MTIFGGEFVKKVLLSWSSGKDSAWTLHVLQQSPEIKVVGLLSTINQHFGRVAMHGTRIELVRAQAEAADLPLWEVPLPWPCSNPEYERAMADVCERAVAEDVTAMAFGDLFLEDVRRYRVEKLQATGLEPIFPLWKQDTRLLLQEMLGAGLKARIVCVDPSKLEAKFAGKDLGDTWRDFPENVDACGENGEFHSFVYAGPMFREPIPIRIGETVTRDRFVYTDVLPLAPNLGKDSGKKTLTTLQSSRKITPLPAPRPSLCP
jgi:uncharacterized protein (TIGR00290 family)